MANIIEVRDLHKSFGDLHVLRGVNLEVKEGERIAIIGGSGCGKSVFLRSLELLEKPDEGQIVIDGKEITAKGANIDKIRQSMGMVYQKFHLFTHMDVMDNLCLAPTKLLKIGRKDAEEKAMDLLRQVGLVSKAHAMPSVLSGGQQQRIAICRSLMMDPKVLLFDEPTSALDPTMVGEVLAVIRMLAKRSLTMLIVTHEMNFAREVANRILFFADGGIYEQGTPEEIFDNPQKEKTIEFIHKIKQFAFEIDSKEFDLMQLHGGIQIFGEKYGIGSSRVYRLQICCEELIYEMLDHCFPDGQNIDANISISYSELDKATEIILNCAGEQYNPFENKNDEEEPLGVTILRRIAKNIDCKYETNKNKIVITI